MIHLSLSKRAFPCTVSVFCLPTGFRFPLGPPPHLPSSPDPHNFPFNMVIAAAATFFNCGSMSPASQPQRREGNGKCRSLSESSPRPSFVLCPRSPSRRPSFLVLNATSQQLIPWSTYAGGGHWRRLVHLVTRLIHHIRTGSLPGCAFVRLRSSGCILLFPRGNETRPDQTRRGGPFQSLAIEGGTQEDKNKNKTCTFSQVHHWN